MVLFKKFLAVMTAAILMICCAAVTVSAEDDAAAAVKAPVLSMLEGKNITVDSGMSTVISFRFTIKNGAALSRADFTLSGANNDITIQNPETSSNDLKSPVSFMIKTSKTAKSATHNLTLNVVSYGADGTTANAQSFPVALKINSRIEARGLTIDSYKVSKDNIAPGDKFDIVVTLKNETGVDIKNAELELDGLNSEKFVLDKGATKQYINMAKGETGKVTYSLIAQKGITLVRETVNLKLSYSLDASKTDLSSSTSTMIIINCNPEEKKESNYTAFDLSMTNYTVSNDKVAENTKFDLVVDVKNSGKYSIDKARISLTTDGSKFSIDSGLGFSDFSIDKGASKRFTFKLIGCAGIAAERETIPIKIEYGTVSNTAYATINCVPKKENDDKAKRDLAVTSYSTDVGTVAENTVFNLSVEVHNTTNREIKEARITLNNLDGTKFAIDGGLAYVDFDIAAGATKYFNFRLVGCGGITSIREVIPIQLDFEKVSNTTNATVKCLPKNTDKDGQKVFAPNIIIENYTYGDAEYVTAGKEFPLNITIKNVSTVSDIENLKVTVSGGTLTAGNEATVAYSPANSSNTFFFDRLAVQDSVDISMKMLSLVTAKPNSYPLNIAFVYEYSINNQHYKADNVQESISIPLRQEDRVSINDPDVPNGGIYVNQQFTVSTNIINKGKSDIYNVNVSVSGDDFTADSNSYYIGNIKSGSEEYYDVKLTPLSAGSGSGSLKITYEDANGDAKETDLPFTYNAEELIAEDFGMGMMMPEEPVQEGPNFVLLIGIGVGIIVLIIVIVVIVKHAKKKKAEMMDDEDL
ncbi:MAG: hypothetical protein II820_03540 [Ruminiclostridium sp.]|nr:hypothetical protein [Ruminiclostridium sp.]